MTMFADSDAVKVGLDVVKRDYPQFTGKGVRLLQVELDNGSGWSNPDANLYLPATSTVKIGYHSTEVGKVIRQIAPNTTVVNMEEKAFIDTLMNAFVGDGLSFPTWNPTDPVWDVECHAYTATRSIFDVDICKAQDRRVLQHNLGSFAACGNSLAEVNGEWNRSVQTNVVGTPSSPRGDFPIGGGLTQPYPDYTIPTQWTSIATPVMAAGYAVLLEAAGMDHDKAENALKASITDGFPRFDKALAAIVGSPPPPAEPPPPVTTESNLNKIASISSLFSANSKYGEGLDKLTDGTTAKCLHFNKWSAYTFTFPREVMPTKIRVQSANDFPVRDPKKIVIWRDDDDQQWFQVAVFDNIAFSSRFQWKELPFTSNLASHRWKIEAESSGLTSAGDTGKGILQIAELEFWGSEVLVEPPPPPPVTLPSTVELALTDINNAIPALSAEQKTLLRNRLAIISDST